MNGNIQFNTPSITGSSNAAFDSITANNISNEVIYANGDGELTGIDKSEGFLKSVLNGSEYNYSFTNLTISDIVDDLTANQVVYTDSLKNLSTGIMTTDTLNNFNNNFNVTTTTVDINKIVSFKGNSLSANFLLYVDENYTLRCSTLGLTAITGMDSRITNNTEAIAIINNNITNTNTAISAIMQAGVVGYWFNTKITTSSPSYIYPSGKIYLDSEYNLTYKAGTAYKVCYLDEFQQLTTSTINNTELGCLSNCTDNIQTKLSLIGPIDTSVDNLQTLTTNMLNGTQAFSTINQTYNGYAILTINSSLNTGHGACAIHFNVQDSTLSYIKLDESTNTFSIYHNGVSNFKIGDLNIVYLANNVFNIKPYIKYSTLNDYWTTINAYGTDLAIDNNVDISGSLQVDNGTIYVKNTNNIISVASDSSWMQMVGSGDLYLHSNKTTAGSIISFNTHNTQRIKITDSKTYIYGDLDISGTLTYYNANYNVLTVLDVINLLNTNNTISGTTTELSLDSENNVLINCGSSGTTKYIQFNANSFESMTISDDYVKVKQPLICMPASTAGYLTIDTAYESGGAQKYGYITYNITAPSGSAKVHQFTNDTLINGKITASSGSITGNLYIDTLQAGYDSSFNPTITTTTGGAISCVSLAATGNVTGSNITTMANDISTTVTKADNIINGSQTLSSVTASGAFHCAYNVSLASQFYVEEDGKTHCLNNFYCDYIKPITVTNGLTIKGFTIDSDLQIKPGYNNTTQTDGYVTYDIAGAADGGTHYFKDRVKVNSDLTIGSNLYIYNAVNYLNATISYLQIVSEKTMYIHAGKTAGAGSLLNLNTNGSERISISDSTTTIKNNVNVTGLTASQIVVTDGSKNLVSSAACTLAELACLSGAASNLQAQITGMSTAILAQRYTFSIYKTTSPYSTATFGTLFLARSSIETSPDYNLQYPTTLGTNFSIDATNYRITIINAGTYKFKFAVNSYYNGGNELHILQVYKNGTTAGTGQLMGTNKASTIQTTCPYANTQVSGVIVAAANDVLSLVFTITAVTVIYGINIEIDRIA